MSRSRKHFAPRWPNPRQGISVGRQSGVERRGRGGRDGTEKRSERGSNREGKGGIGLGRSECEQGGRYGEERREESERNGREIRKEQGGWQLGRRIGKKQGRQKMYMIYKFSTGVNAGTESGIRHAIWKVTHLQTWTTTLTNECKEKAFFSFC